MGVLVKLLFRIQEVKLDQAKSRLLSQILCDVDGEIQESLYWDTGKVVSACAVVANWKESESCIKMAEADNSNGKISSTPSSRQSSCFGACPHCSPTERTQSFISSTLYLGVKKINKNKLIFKKKKKKRKFQKKKKKKKKKK